MARSNHKIQLFEAGEFLPQFLAFLNLFRRAFAIFGVDRVSELQGTFGLSFFNDEKRKELAKGGNGLSARRPPVPTISVDFLAVAREPSAEKGLQNMQRAGIDLGARKIQILPARFQVNNGDAAFSVKEPCGVGQPPIAIQMVRQIVQGGRSDNGAYWPCIRTTAVPTLIVSRAHRFTMRRTAAIINRAERLRSFRFICRATTPFAKIVHLAQSATKVFLSAIQECAGIVNSCRHIFQNTLSPYCKYNTVQGVLTNG